MRLVSQQLPLQIGALTALQAFARASPDYVRSTT